MLSKRQRQRELACAEDIALLYTLNPPSYAPLANKPPYLKSQPDPSRALPFETEVSLTSTLAFLSGISDDSSHVVAVCVEELPSRKGICVRVAVNKATSGAAEVVLQRIKDGLQMVLKCLSRLPTDSDNHIHDQTLAAILELSQDRLLGRLGVQRAGVNWTMRGKTFFGSPIQKIIEAVSQHKYTKKLEEEARRFSKLAGKLINHLKELQTCKITALTDCLRRLTHASSQLMASIKLDELLAGLAIDPLLKTGFVTRLSKVARYYESSTFLVQLAKRSLLFGHTEVTIIKLDEEAFLRVPYTETVHRLSECLSRCHPGVPLPLNVKKICQQIKTDPTTADAVFRKATKKILAESKVHAEVQIVAFYELHPAMRKPRVICSNKDACYLCNLFIQVHGMYYVPKSHGKLYTGWRVPPILSLGDAHAQLDKALQSRIRNVVQDFKDFPDRERVLNPNQNESTIFPFTTLMSSLEGIPLPVVETPETAQVQKPQRLPQGQQERPQHRLPERPQPSASSPSKSHIAQTSTPPIDGRDEGSPDQQPTFEPTSTTSEQSSTTVFSPTPVVPPPGDLLSSLQTPPESPPEAADPILVALQPPPKQDHRSLPPSDTSPTASQHPDPTMKSDSSQKTAGDKNPARTINKIQPPPLKPEPHVHHHDKPQVSLQNGHPKTTDPEAEQPAASSHQKLTPANLDLLNQLENQKLTRPASRTSSELAEMMSPSLARGKPKSQGNSRQGEAKHAARNRVESSSEQDDKILLRRGKTTSVWMRGGVLPPVCTTGGVDIFLENIDDDGLEKRSRLGRERRKVARVEITWLDEEDEKRLRLKRGRNYHRLEGLETGVEVDGGSGEVVALEIGGEVVIVEVVREVRGSGFERMVDLGEDGGLRG
ncbi:hypothetical protein QBC41DRAFT_395512 [Cercophora samala]|uniref:Uncharacterized protein n=1 Tax=Cercophora samala TaxID=330535 RepID=A0AA39ZB10_9PEZI|nr:hypothetical protein QBC41DRAFT_395512 [Cercophora samala]